MKTRLNKICKVMLTMALGLLISFPANAQLFNLGEQSYFNRTTTNDGNGNVSDIIVHGGMYDETNNAPIGSGVLLLTALGAAYAVKKRKR